MVTLSLKAVRLDINSFQQNSGVQPPQSGAQKEFTGAFKEYLGEVEEQLRGVGGHHKPVELDCQENRAANFADGEDMSIDLADLEAAMGSELDSADIEAAMGMDDSIESCSD